MNRIVWAIVPIVVLAVPVWAQPSNPTWNFVASAPSGVCGAGPGQFVVTPGTLYTCQNGTWGQVGGGSGPGISLTTSGPSGAASLAGTVLNIPQYQAALSLLKGTYADGDLCTYTASGTLLNCNTAT